MSIILLSYMIHLFIWGNYEMFDNEVKMLPWEATKEIFEIANLYLAIISKINSRLHVLNEYFIKWRARLHQKKLNNSINRHFLQFICLYDEV